MSYSRLPVLLSLLLLVFAGTATAGGIYASHWNRYQTDHFDILFHDEVRPQADLARGFLETAYVKITKNLGMRERGVRISVVLTGRPDESNGSATPVGHVITIYTRPAQTMASGDIAWLKRVLAHELAHQITFLTLRKGFWGIYSEIYKTTHLPAWFVEGLAQYQAETWDAKRNTFFAHALYNSALEPYPDLAVYTKFSPVSSRLVYEQGHAFVRFLADKEGPDFWARVLKRIRVIPVWSEFKALLSPLTAGCLPLEGAIRAESGRSTRLHYREFADSLLAALPENVTPAVPWNGGIKGFSVVWQVRRAPDGTVWFTGQRDWETSVTGLYAVRAGKLSTEVGSGVDPVFSLSADGKRVAYVRSYNDRNLDAVEKLFLLEAGKSRFISDGASHPVFWGADSVVFSKYLGGRQALAFCGIAGGCREVSPDSLDGFYALSPSSQGLLLNATDSQGRTGIYEYTVEGGFTPVFRDTVTAEFPLQAADGSVWMLHDRGGLLQVDGLDRATGAVFPVATYPLGTFFPQLIAPGVIASVAQTGKAREWAMQPVEIRAPSRDDSAAVAPMPKSATAFASAPASATASAQGASSDSARAPDSANVFRAPGFFAGPRPEFPVNPAVAYDSGAYHSVLALRPLIAGPLIYPVFNGGAFGAFIALADPVGFHSLSAAAAPNDGDPLYDVEYVNNETPVQIALLAYNVDYRLMGMRRPAGWTELAAEERISEYSARFDLPMPVPLPLGHSIRAGLKGQALIREWRFAGRHESDTTKALRILDVPELRRANFIPWLYLGYSYFRPNAYGLVHPLLETQLSAGSGVGLDNSEPHVFWYASQTFPIVSELTFTAQYQGQWRGKDLSIRRGVAMGSDGSTEAYFAAGARGYDQDAYAGIDFPIHKGYLGEWPLLGLLNYLGAGAFVGYGREAYVEYPDLPGSGYLYEVGAVGAKLDLLFHVMRRVPLVVSGTAQWDYLNERTEFRIGAQAAGVPRSFSLFGTKRERRLGPVRSR